MRGGVLRVSAIAYMGKHLSMKDWMVYSEVFGMPVRVARYDPSTSPEEKRELLRMLQTLGSDAAGIFSKAVELELSDLPARVFQHELDHLDGVLFIDNMGTIARLSSRGRLRELERDYRRAQERGEIPPDDQIQKSLDEPK